jgi:hypothetical protein
MPYPLIDYLILTPNRTRAPMVVVREGGNDGRGEECTRYTLASMRPQSGRPTPCEHSEKRLGKGMGGQRIRLTTRCRRRGASKIGPNFEVRKLR